MRINSFVLAVLAAVTTASASCTSEQKIAAMKQEIATIRSHSPVDAAKIPYGPFCHRIFTITPNETKPHAITVPAGVTDITTRLILCSLGTALQADVPQGSDHYQVNRNGTVTVDYIQTDGITLQNVDVREIAGYDEEKCQISGITGYVRGNVEAFLGDFNVFDILKGAL